MVYYIDTECGSGCKYHTKEEFLNELSMMIDDCTDNGGTFFAAVIDSDKSCYYMEDDYE